MDLKEQIISVLQQCYDPELPVVLERTEPRAKEALALVKNSEIHRRHLLRGCRKAVAPSVAEIRELNRDRLALASRNPRFREPIHVLL